MRHRPEQMGLLPDGVSSAGDDGTNVETSPASKIPLEEEFGPREAVATRAFWMLAVAFVVWSVVITAIEVYQVPFFTEDLGMSLIVAAAVTSLFPLASIPGRIIFGWLADVVDIRLLLASMYLLQAVGLVVLSQAQSLTWIPFYLVILAPAFGGTVPVRNVIVARYYGRKNLGTISGLFPLVGLPGSALGPVFIGWVFDRMGTYRPGFLVIAALMVVASGALLMASRPQVRVNSSMESSNLRR